MCNKHHQPKASKEACEKICNWSITGKTIRFNDEFCPECQVKTLHATQEHNVGSRKLCCDCCKETTENPLISYMGC